MAEPDIMTWFPRREDYEQQVSVAPDETYSEKLLRYSNIQILLLSILIRKYFSHFSNLCSLHNSTCCITIG